MTAMAVDSLMHSVAQQCVDLSITLLLIPSRVGSQDEWPVNFVALTVVSSNRHDLVAIVAAAGCYGRDRRSATILAT